MLQMIEDLSDVEAVQKARKAIAAGEKTISIKMAVALADANG